MDIGKISYYARKLHRLFLLLIIITGIIMMGTGTAMKYPDLAPIDQIQARIIHSAVSTWFSVIFVFMMITGLVMYFVPVILKLRQRSNQHSP